MKKDLIGISDSRQLVSVDKRAKSYGKGREARKGLSVIALHLLILKNTKQVSQISKGFRGECSSKSVKALGVVEQVGKVYEIE
ncbi:hypothetical protein Q3G72_000187 [Acer saccharum]|nr:hypothetical protein Q3G72_000187 [Acer saccharum]